jgi:hypothetical protein
MKRIYVLEQIYSVGGTAYLFDADAKPIRALHGRDHYDLDQQIREEEKVQGAEFIRVASRSSIYEIERAQQYEDLQDDGGHNIGDLCTEMERLTGHPWRYDDGYECIGRSELFSDMCVRLRSGGMWVIEDNLLLMEEVSASHPVEALKNCIRALKAAVAELPDPDA